MTYNEPLYRPPSEASSLIIQVTLGCSHNRCTFCRMYKNKSFRIKDIQEIKQQIDMLVPEKSWRIKRVFLADGNALVVDTETLIKTINYLNAKLPNLERVSIYAGPKDILEKSGEELKILKKHGLTLHFLGIESGNEKILKEINKGATAKEIIDAGQKIMQNGLKLSATVILGLGGKEMIKEHAVDTARIVNKIQPTYLAPLTLMVDSRAPLYNKIKRGEFIPLNSKEILQELEILIEHLDLKETIFRSNHASNLLPLKGTLNKDKEKLLNNIKSSFN